MQRCVYWEHWKHAVSHLIHRLTAKQTEALEPGSVFNLQSGLGHIHTTEKTTAGESRYSKTSKTNKQKYFL